MTMIAQDRENDQREISAADALNARDKGMICDPGRKTVSVRR